MKALKITAMSVVAIAAVAILLMFVGIPAQFLITPILDRIYQDTGYRLKIAGSAKVTLLPSPQILLSGLTLHDMRHPASDPVASVESLKVSSTLKNLFGDRPRLAEFIITRPVLRMPLVRQRAARDSSSGGAQGGTGKGRFPEFTVDHFAVHNGNVMFVSADNQVEGRLDDIEVVGTLSEANQFDLVAWTKAGNQSLRVKLTGQTPAGGFDGGPIPVEFSLEAPGLLREALAGSMDIRRTGSLIRFNNINGAIGAGKFSGWASVDAASKPLVKLELDFQKLDIGAAHIAGSGSSGSDTASNMDRPWSRVPINLDHLNYVDAEVQLSAASLNIGTIHLSPISTSATIIDGIVRTSFPQMGLYGGQATAGLAIDATRPEHSYALAMNIANVRALPLLTDTADFTSLDGRMTANMDLRAWGNTQQAIMSSLDGTMSVLLQDGEIRSINIAQMIRNVGASILQGWQAGTTKKTDFTEFAGGFRFQNGKATTENLQLTGPLVRVTGAGTADIGAKTLQFRLEPKLVMSLEGQGSSAAKPAGLGVPVMVQGTWGQPKIYPDFAGMLDNPDAAFARLRELGLSLFGAPAGTQPDNASAPGTSSSGGAIGGADTLIQGIGDMLKGLGSNRDIPSNAPTPR